MAVPQNPGNVPEQQHPAFPHRRILEIITLNEEGEVEPPPEIPPSKRHHCIIKGCDRTYVHKFAATLHVKYHFGPYSCFLCDKCIKNTWEHVTRHIKEVHGVTSDPAITVIRQPTKCPICSNVLSSERALYTHYKQVHQKSLATEKRDLKRKRKQDSQQVAYKTEASSDTEDADEPEATS